MRLKPELPVVCFAPCWRRFSAFGNARFLSASGAELVQRKEQADVWTAGEVVVVGGGRLLVGLSRALASAWAAMSLLAWT